MVSRALPPLQLWLARRRFPTIIMALSLQSRKKESRPRWAAFAVLGCLGRQFQKKTGECVHAENTGTGLVMWMDARAEAAVAEVRGTMTEAPRSQLAAPTTAGAAWEAAGVVERKMRRGGGRAIEKGAAVLAALNRINRIADQIGIGNMIVEQSVTDRVATLVVGAGNGPGERTRPCGLGRSEAAGEIETAAGAVTAAGIVTMAASGITSEEETEATGVAGAALVSGAVGTRTVVFPSP